MIFLAAKKAENLISRSFPYSWTFQNNIEFKISPFNCFLLKFLTESLKFSSSICLLSDVI